MPENKLNQLLVRTNWVTEFTEEVYQRTGPDKHTQEDEAIPLSIMQMYDEWATELCDRYDIEDDLAHARLAIHLEQCLGYGMAGVETSDWIAFYGNDYPDGVRLLTYGKEPVAIIEMLPKNGLISPIERERLRPDLQVVMGEGELCARLSPQEDDATVIIISRADAALLRQGSLVDLSGYFRTDTDEDDNEGDDNES